MFVCLRVVLNSKIWTATFFPVGRHEEALRNETYTTDKGFLFFALTTGKLKGKIIYGSVKSLELKDGNCFHSAFQPDGPMVLS